LEYVFSPSPWLRVGVLAAPILLILGLWRYFDQRLKSTNQAYWSVITLTARGGKVEIEKSTPTGESPTHAGGVVFRQEPDKVEYLFVEAESSPNELVLPKGHVEEGERHSETAVREVKEETGVWARIIDEAGDVTWVVNGDRVSNRFYLMEHIGDGRGKERDRRHKWLTFQEAVEPPADRQRPIIYEETSNLLRRTDALRRNRR
jgi:ADP-ribose pyrophosphatase YjhB (NUDIX family)